MENKSHRSLEGLNNLLQKTYIPWWEWKIKENKVRSHGLRERLLGYDPENFQGKPYKVYTDLLHPEDYDRTIQALQDGLEGEKSIFQIDYRMKNAEGGYSWLMDRGLVIERDEEGEPLLMRGLIIQLGAEIGDVDKDSKLFQKIRESFPKSIDDFPVICSSCGRYKVEKNTWKQITDDLREVFKRDISHGICPKCLKELYPKYAEKDLDQK